MILQKFSILRKVRESDYLVAFFLLLIILYKVVGCVSVINYKVMNELFMDRDILSTKEFLSIVFNSHDLTKLVNEGKLKRTGRGLYSLPIIDRELVYPLINVVERVRGGEAVVVLEPLQEDEAMLVLETVSNISNVRAFSIDEDTKKRIVLRYIETTNFSLDLNDLLERANYLYESEFYDGYIEMVETLLPSIYNPSSDLYLKLGFSYQQLIASDINNASKMIDYFMISAITNEENKGKLLVDFMREKYKYNGVKIKDNFPGLGHVFEKTIQCKFNLES